MALSIEQCRELLNDENYSDEQLIKLKDSLSVIVSNVIDSVVAEQLEVGVNGIDETKRG